MLAIIHNDHVNMSRLLKLLRKKINQLEQDEKIDYRLIKSVITYLRSYSDKYHHPMEDLIYDYCLNCSALFVQAVTRLSEEHKLIKKVTIELDELLDVILLDAIVPKDLCIEKLRNFVEMQAAHLAYEENEVFPLIRDSLSSEDWLKIKQQWQYEEHKDPLFGDNVADKYRTLATHVKDI